MRGILESFTVQTLDYNNRDNGITIEVNFSLRTAPSIHTLSFPFYQYQGALLEGDLEPFISAVSLDGQPFFGLT
jgi:hypothetical protein